MERPINRFSGVVVFALSLTTLLVVLSGYLQPHQFAQPDEGAAAHVFQLSVAALAPMVVLFLATVDWRRPGRSAGVLAISGVLVCLAFGGLYYGEHYYR
jgi:hypothetical protein